MDDEAEQREFLLPCAGSRPVNIRLMCLVQGRSKDH